MKRKRWENKEDKRALYATNDSQEEDLMMKLRRITHSNIQQDCITKTADFILVYIFSRRPKSKSKKKYTSPSESQCEDLGTEKVGRFSDGSLRSLKV